MAAAILPVLRHAARRRGGSLVDTSRRATDTAGSARARAWLIGTETALALVLLSSAVLVYRAFEATAALHPGFDPEGVVAGQLRLSESAYASIESRTLLLDRVLEAVRAVPGVADAATTQNLFVPGAAFVTIAYPTESPQPGETGHTVQFRRISDGYFRTMRIPFEAGRDFDDRDRPATEPAVIVSRRFVDAYLGGGTPLGRRIRRGANPPLRIVGIVGDVSDVGYGQAPQPTLYVAYRQGSVVAVPITLVVRATGRALEAVSAIEAAVWSVDPAQPLANVTLLSQYLADSLGPDRFRSVLLGAFAGLGLLLASVGIFGVTARSVVERTREVGIRIALGGSAGAVWRTVAGRPLLAVGAGGLAGVGLSLVAARALSAYLPGLDRSAFDGLWPAAVVLAGCAVAAAVLPARRAARVDPLTALRVD
jgi:putative ABC transport system permease protein